MALEISDLLFDTPPDEIREDGETSATPPKRRGRPPGSKNGTAQPRVSASAGRTVNEAMGAMQSAYDLIGLILRPFAPTAADIFMAGVPKAQDSNKRAFEASPKLAKKIANGGEKGGVAGFFIGNAVLVAPVMMVAVGEIQAKVPASKPKEPRQPRPQPQRQRQQPQPQDIPRSAPQVPTGEGFEIPQGIPVFKAFS